MFYSPTCASRQLRFLPFLLACLFLVAASSASAGVIVGLPAAPGDGNCFPFGCSYSGEYQQVYSASQFSGPITITALEFYNTADNGGTTQMNTGLWTISLSTSDADWNSLSSDFASNIGADSTQVFSGNLVQPWVFGNTLHVPLSTPFTYNPALGNLLLDVVASGVTSLGDLYFDVNRGNSYLGRVYGSGTTHSGYGLVTGFSSGIASVPEPGSFALIGLGLAALAAVARRRSA